MSDATGDAVSDWMAMDQWRRCSEWAKPGIVFELVDDAGRSLFAQCIQAVPAVPFDWPARPTRFRAVREAPAQRSGEMPPPAAR